MATVDISDISFIDIDELGVRPRDWTEEGNGMDFDDTTGNYFGQGKTMQFNSYSDEIHSLINRKQFSIDEANTIMCDDHRPDDSDYEIDPETGEKIFREAVIASSPSLSSPTTSNYNWIEEYLSNLPGSSANQSVPITKRTSEFLFETHSISDRQFNWKNSNWTSKFPFDESTERQHLFDPMMDEKNLIAHQITSPMFIPMSHQNSFNTFCSISGDDELSTSSSGHEFHQRQYHSSIGSESTTPDSEINFDGHFIETKLEKIEPDEHKMAHVFVRRSSTRTNTQGQQDEETLHRYNIPLTVFDITQSTTEEYNRHLARLNYLTPEQIHIIKDIRRRGKNKIAAQNCRKRKANSVEILSEEVDELKRVKHQLEEKKRAFQQQITETRHQYEYLHRQVLPDRQLPPAIFVK